jgi:class 3 adenylate cyclase/DNA-binding CsgD family transcriptional regulator/tetratricopeptide (TPR) repeat protein
VFDCFAGVVDLPIGTVTFLFTDVEGSTRLAKALGAARYGAVLDEHHRLLRDAFRQADGVEVDSQGDGFFVAFRRASEAVRAATLAQRALAEHRWPEGTSVRVRIGIHTGEASVVDEGYRGLAVHRAARICTSAHGGQVLLSDTTRDLVEPDLPADVRLRDVGLVQLRDIDRPERLFQLVVEGLPEAFPPPRAPTPREVPAHAADLVEREAELAALDALVAAAPTAGRLLAIEGPAGIGKTRLLAEARERGHASGMRVLAARGSELESEFSYGVVRQLFELLIASAPREERSELLAGAAELARPIFDPAHFGAEPDADSSLAMLHGLFWLTANLTGRRPALLAIDDLHWCDPSSLRWLAYLLPRLEGLSLLLVVALRPAEPGSELALLRRITTDPLATVLRPGALSEEGTGKLMRHVFSADIEPPFRAALHEAGGGNPLLVRELASAVAAEGLAPTAANASRLRDLGGQAVSLAVSLRLSRLSAGATSLAQAVAILGDDAELRHAAALAGLDEATASDAATDLGHAEILYPRDQLSFVHPVVRAAVYGQLSALERGRRHAQAARLLADAKAEPERVAGQLLHARPGGDAWAVSTLREAGRSALARGAADSAVAYLRRALEEGAEADTPAVLHELGTAEARVGDADAVEHLKAALAATTDGPARARLALELGVTLFSTQGRSQEAVEVLERAIGELPRDSDLALRLESALLGIARFEPALHHLANERLERLRTSVSHRGPENQVVLANLASAAVRAGANRRETLDLAERALAGAALLEEHFDPEFLYAVVALIGAGELETSHRLLSEAIENARKRGLVSQFCLASACRALVALHRGSLTDAVADAELSLDAAELHQLQSISPYAIAFLSDALVELGDLTQARLVIDSAGLGSDIESYGQTAFFTARGRLRLAEGDHARALDDLLTAGAFLEDFGIHNPAVWPWRSDASTALLALDRRDEARRYAADDLSLARQWGAPRPLGKSLVASGLAEGGEDGLALLREAVAVLAPSQARLEHAKALVELGAALRRANQRSESREPLRQGLELATRCGAAPLAERAETELLATGARPRRIALSGVESLTPSERRVAQMAAEGGTNREIAQALFVTPKTVEVHLSSVYRKLDIGSRSQLPRALAESGRVEAIATGR